MKNLLSSTAVPGTMINLKRFLYRDLTAAAFTNLQSTY